MSINEQSPDPRVPEEPAILPVDEAAVDQTDPSWLHQRKLEVGGASALGLLSIILATVATVNVIEGHGSDPATPDK